MDINDVIFVIRNTAAGASRQQIAKRLAISKSSVQHCLNQLQQLQIPLEEAMTMGPSELQALLGRETDVRTGYASPDFEHVYVLANVHGKHRKSLKELWQQYIDKAASEAKKLSYKGFCKAYQRFSKDLPESCREVQLINQWNFGDVAMIDYSGDGLEFKPLDSEAGKPAKAQIFVGVLAASRYIFCCATPRQTRDDWLDAQIKMFEFFGGVPRYIYLDNSTSLVVRADKYAPRICQQYRDFCDYYMTTPVAVRPGKPRDKAMVEGAVRIVQEQILRPLRNREFFSLEEVNRAILKELDQLNRRPLTTRADGLSRFDLMQDEKLVLHPLPPVAYELSSETKVLTVQKGSVVRFNNVRYSVPFGHIGRKVRVVKNNRAQTVSVFDLSNGERIWVHYIGSNKGQDVLAKEHLPPKLRSVTMTVDELVESISQNGDAARTLCQQYLLAQNHGEVARKLLRGVNNLRTSMGEALFRETCERTLKRAAPSYKVLQEEAEAVIGGVGQRQRARDCDRSGLSANDLRGSGYYDDVIETQAEE